MAHLKCSACSAPMQVFFYGSVEIDVCSACHGTWFDVRELDKVSGRMPMFKPETTSDRDCPICAFRMQRGQLQSRVEAERCEHCFGFFLDKGELATLAGFDLRPSRGPISPPIPEAAAPAPAVAAGAVAAAAATERTQEVPAVAAPQRPDVEASRRARAASFLNDDAPLQDDIFWGADSQPQQVGFECVVCAKRFPMTAGNFYRGGLACPGCTPQVQTSRGEREQANRNWIDHGWGSVRGGSLTLTDFLSALTNPRWRW